VTRTAPDDKAMAAFYNDCSIFLVPSRAEGFGLPALEAMACGTAVVSTDNGGVRDFASPGENLLLAPVGDAEAIAGQLARLIIDVALRRQVATAGLATAQEFSWDRSTDAFEDQLKKIMR
jgi:glycosyltransferase involved in cell wall biosynthesis